jgi:hypothetical protein
MAPLLIDKDGVSIHIQSREHLPPHVHAFAGDDEALIDIRTGKVMKGKLPGKKIRIVQDWLSHGERRKLTEENFYELNPALRPQVSTTSKEKPLKRRGGENGAQK